MDRNKCHINTCLLTLFSYAILKGTRKMRVNNNEKWEDITIAWETN
jgi:hypothetical protein